LEGCCGKTSGKILKKCLFWKVPAVLRPGTCGEGSTGERYSGGWKMRSAFQWPRDGKTCLAERCALGRIIYRLPSPGVQTPDFGRLGSSRVPPPASLSFIIALYPE